jgi:hypothetical protein
MATLAIPMDFTRDVTRSAERSELDAINIETSCGSKAPGHIDKYFDVLGRDSR